MKHIINEFLEFVDKHSKPVNESYEKNYSLEDLEGYIGYFLEQYKGGWIICEDRLPDIEADVLLSLRSLDIYTGFRTNTEGLFYVEGEGYVEYKNVMAWQPLPEPFNT